MSVVDGTGTRDSRGLEISSVCGKVVPPRQSSAIGRDGDGAISTSVTLTEPGKGMAPWLT